MVGSALRPLRDQKSNLLILKPASNNHFNSISFQPFPRPQETGGYNQLRTPIELGSAMQRKPLNTELDQLVRPKLRQTTGGINDPTILPAPLAFTDPQSIHLRFILFKRTGRDQDTSTRPRTTNNRRCQRSALIVVRENHLTAHAAHSTTLIKGHLICPPARRLRYSHANCKISSFHRSRILSNSTPAGVPCARRDRSDLLSRSGRSSRNRGATSYALPSHRVLTWGAPPFCQRHIRNNEQQKHDNALHTYTSINRHCHFTLGTSLPMFSSILLDLT